MIPFIGEAFKGLTGLGSVTIDNHVFRLHYILTSVLLFGASGILITNQLFGDPIDCLSDGYFQKEDTLKQTIDNFCWVAATYTIPQLYGHQYNTKLSKDYILYDGVGQFDVQAGHTTQRQLYYRWIFFVLFIQGIFFYFPHYLWRAWEGGRMESLSKNLDTPFESNLEMDRRTTRINLLLNSLEAHDVNSYEWYTYRLYFCELLNLIVTVGAYFVTNMVLDKEFNNIGFEIMKIGWSEATIADRLFPIHAKCLWRTVGPSGSAQAHDALCLLPLNTFNRWTFKFLWFWFVFIGSLNLLWLLFRLVTIIFKGFRSYLLRLKAGSINSSHSHHEKGQDCIDYICQIFPNSDWFVLYQLADNTDSIAFQSILEGLCERLLFKHKSIRRSTCPDLVVMKSDKNLSIDSEPCNKSAYFECFE